jgi:hypothetical protein
MITHKINNQLQCIISYSAKSNEQNDRPFKESKESKKKKEETHSYIHLPGEFILNTDRLALEQHREKRTKESNITTNIRKAFIDVITGSCDEENQII